MYRHDGVPFFGQPGQPLALPASPSCKLAVASQVLLLAFDSNGLSFVSLFTMFWPFGILIYILVFVISM